LAAGWGGGPHLSLPRALIGAARLALASCNSQTASGHQSASIQGTSTPSSTGFTLTSPGLQGGRWPPDATCDGSDSPPDFHWTAGPAATASYAIQVFDPDAPNGGFTHWMLANEPPSLRGPTPRTGISGRNDFGNEGYKGPCPPHGSAHHYVVTAFAVDTMLTLQPLYSRAQFQAALARHVLAQSSITAIYSR